MSWLHRLFPPKPIHEDSRFGYAICGTGHGAEKLCDALRDSPQTRVAAVLSSSLQRAQDFAKKHKIPQAYSYDQLEALHDDPTVDAVYLALPVGLHRSFTERTVAAGKHVLCEKPMAASLADAEAMISSARAVNRLLMIAYRLDYDPMHLEAARLLAKGALGAVQHVRSNFGIVAKPGWRFDPALAGGGSLFDVGIYPIHALHELFGEVTVKQAHIIEAAGTRMELDARWHGTLQSGGTFTCHSSYVERVPDTLEIRGTLGTVTLTHAFGYERTRLLAEFRNAEPSLKLNDQRNHPTLFRLEAEHLAGCVREGATLRSPGEAGLRDLRTIALIESLATRTTR